jgi:hypothetical protein
MTSWTSDELTKIDAADELQLATLRDDGTLRKPVTTWVARAGDNLYIRAVNGPTGKWFRHAQERYQGHVAVGSISKDVHFQEVDDDVKDDIDTAYRSKYHSRSDASHIGLILTPQARAATLKLVPLS